MLCCLRCCLWKLDKRIWSLIWCSVLYWFPLNIQYCDRFFERTDLSSTSDEQLHSLQGPDVYSGRLILVYRDFTLDVMLMNISGFLFLDAIMTEIMTGGYLSPVPAVYRKILSEGLTLPAVYGSADPEGDHGPWVRTLLLCCSSVYSHRPGFSQEIMFPSMASLDFTRK